MDSIAKLDGGNYSDKLDAIWKHLEIVLTCLERPGKDNCRPVNLWSILCDAAGALHVLPISVQPVSDERLSKSRTQWVVDLAARVAETDASWREWQKKCIPVEVEEWAVEVKNELQDAAVRALQYEFARRSRDGSSTEEPPAGAQSTTPEAANRFTESTKVYRELEDACIVLQRLLSRTTVLIERLENPPWLDQAKDEAKEFMAQPERLAEASTRVGSLWNSLPIRPAQDNFVTVIGYGGYRDRVASFSEALYTAGWWMREGLRLLVIGNCKCRDRDHYDYLSRDFCYWSTDGGAWGIMNSAYIPADEDIDPASQWNAFRSWCSRPAGGFEYLFGSETVRDGGLDDYYRRLSTKAAIELRKTAAACIPDILAGMEMPIATGAPVTPGKTITSEPMERELAGQWSNPRRVADWLIILESLGTKMSEDEFRDRRGDGTYRYKRQTAKGPLRLLLVDLPSEYRDDMTVKEAREAIQQEVGRGTDR